MFHHSEAETLPLIVGKESGLLPRKGTDLHTKVKKRFTDQPLGCFYSPQGTLDLPLAPRALAIISLSYLILLKHFE